MFNTDSLVNRIDLLEKECNKRRVVLGKMYMDIIVHDKVEDRCLYDSLMQEYVKFQDELKFAKELLNS